MNTRAALAMAVLALAAAGAAAYLHWFDRTPEEQRAHDREILHYSVARIERLIVKSEREVVYEIERQADKWVFKYPSLGDADAGRVLRAIADLRFEARVKSELTGTGPLDRYGLARPKVEVTVREPGASSTIEFGDLNATKDGQYVRLLPGGRVFLTSPLVSALFPTDARAFAPTGTPAEGPAPARR